MIIPSKKSDFFVVGGPLKAKALSYVERPADNELFDRAMASKFAYVLTCRQMGKSSLMNRTAQRLKENGVRTTRIDLTRIGTVQIETWYLGLLAELTRQLRLSTDPETWWNKHAWLGPVQRFTTFLREVVLAEIEEQVVIFIDEIDTTLKLNFSDDFFAAIRAIYNARDEEPILDRLNFILLGVASPPDLIKDNARTPFNIGEEVILQDFSPTDAAVLQDGLEVAHPGQGQAIFAHVYEWTHGHPYLTQRLCKEISEAKQKSWTNKEIDQLVEKFFLSEKSRKEANLQFIQNKILNHPQRRQLLQEYRKIYNGKKIKDNAQSPLHNQLKLAGLIKTEDGYLQVRNQIYRHVFDLTWVNVNTTINWALVVTCIAIFTTVLAVGFIIHNAWVAYQVETFTLKFYQATTPEKRGKYLANIFEPPGLFQVTDYDYIAKELFFGLSGQEQAAIFTVQYSEKEDIITLVKNLYIALADTDNSNSTRPLLEEMAAALPENSEVKIEIENWLGGRRLANEEKYDLALTKYNESLDINSDNPATLYERARIKLKLGQFKEALTDLDRVVAISGQLLDPATPPLSTDTLLSLPTSTTSFSTLSTLTLGTTSVLTTTSIAVVTSSSTPQTGLSLTQIPERLITSKFVTPLEMRNAVRNLIVENPDIVNIPINTSSYVNLQNFGLLSTTFTCQSDRPPIEGPPIDVAVTITSLRNCDTGLPPTIVVGGSYVGDLNNKEIWVLVYPSDLEYYPQTLDACKQLPSDTTEGKWNTTANLGGPPQQYDIVVVVTEVDSEASQEFKLWLQKGCNTNDFPGYLRDELPSGITEVASITINTK